MTRPERTIKVLGPHLAGKKTLMGAMIYMCGLDLKMLEQLQADGIDEYDGIMDYYRQKELLPVFAAKSDSSQPDGIIYVLNATGSENATHEKGHRFTESEMEILKRTKSLILAVNKMDAVNWSKEIYENTTNLAVQRLNALGLSLEKIQMIPISATQGDNILEYSAKSPWLKEVGCSSQGDETSRTLFACLDRM